MTLKTALPVLAIFTGSWLLSSCGGVKYSQLTMMNDVVTLTDSSILSMPVLQIRTDDVLGIQVSSKNPELLIAFQQQKLSAAPGGALAGEGALGIQEGYRVDENGNIILPYIKEVKASGLSTTELRIQITEKLAGYFPDVSVQVRFMNFRVTILGEVLKPSTYIIPNERLTILEAIGMAGDFTPYADRSDVLIVRQRDDNIREFVRINTQSPELFESPYFYLSPNDLVYIEPLKAKEYATQGDWLSRYSIVVAIVINFLTIIATTVFLP